MASAGCLALLAIAIVASSGFIDLNGRGWTAEMVRQRTEILASTQSPRLVVVAGSGSLFGIHAKDLGRRTGWTAVNAATHAALSWDYIDFFALSHLHSGDVALLPIEYEYLVRAKGNFNSLTVRAAHENGMEFFWSLPIGGKIQYLRLLSSTNVYLQIVGKFGFGRVDVIGYWKYPSDLRGDIDTSVGTPSPARVTEAASKPMTARISEMNVSILCRSIKRLSGAGVKVIVTEPNIFDGTLYNRLLISEMRNSMMEIAESCGATYLSVPSKGLMKLDDMLDTRYHLNSRGRAVRTIELANALCAEVLSCPQPNDEFQTTDVE